MNCAAYGGNLLDVRHDPNVARRHEGRQSRGCLAQHGLLTGDIEELLRRPHSAARPKRVVLPRPAAGE